jgi:hypothetical protein
LAFIGVHWRSFAVDLSIYSGHWVSQSAKLPLSHVRIDSRKNEMSPALFEFGPERAGVPPRDGIDPAGVNQVLVENRLSFASESFIGQAQKQLIVDIEAPGIEIGGTSVNDAVDDV